MSKLNVALSFLLLSINAYASDEPMDGIPSLYADSVDGTEVITEVQVQNTETNQDNTKSTDNTNSDNVINKEDKTANLDISKSSVSEDISNKNDNLAKDNGASAVISTVESKTIKPEQVDNNANIDNNDNNSVISQSQSSNTESVVDVKNTDNTTNTNVEEKDLEQVNTNSNKQNNTSEASEKNDATEKTTVVTNDAEVSKNEVSKNNVDETVQTASQNVEDKQIQNQTQNQVQIGEQETNLIPENSTENKGFYDKAYLTNMYLPYFYSEYELPQKLSSNITLLNVTVSDNPYELVYQIGASEQIGNLDLDGDPLNNNVLHRFCKIAIADAILQKLERIKLEFKRGEEVFYIKNLTLDSCMPNVNADTIASLATKEKERLINEFNYAYQQEQLSELTHNYLVNKYAPYALSVIDHKFSTIDETPIITVDRGTLVYTFDMSPNVEAKATKEGAFITNKIQHMCNIKYLRDNILPRINDIALVYQNADTKEVLNTIRVNKDSCIMLDKLTEQN